MRLRRPSRPRRIGVVALGVFLLEPLAAASTNCTPISCCDGLMETTSVGGEAVWRVLPGSSYLYLNVPASFVFSSAAPVYVEVTYYDQGDGSLILEYDSSFGSTLSDFYYRSRTHTRSSRADSLTFVRSYHELLSPAFLGRENGGADLRLTVAGGSGTPLAVQSVRVATDPFPDPQFQYVLTKPWLAPYSGPTRDDVPADTLLDKVLVGYQGWFRTPNDLADRGWGHWSRDGRMVPTSFVIDQWPDLAGFCPHERFRAGEVITQSGEPAYLFSSTTRETVRRHFQWMRKFNIDGAWLQRFASEQNSGAYGTDEWVLAQARESAHLEGRIWAIEYDISGLNDGNVVDVMTTDWRWLVDVVKVREDSRYAREGGKPVVVIWGLPFPDRGISKAKGDAVVDFFVQDPTYGGNYVVCGAPWWWRSQTDWYDHFRRYHALLAWMPQDMAGYAQDASQLRAWGMDYFPHVWPGFSWANLQKQTGSMHLTPRDGGAFYWAKINQALPGNPGRLFIGMFDEYDEGTAIMPMTDDPPHPPPDWGRFITNDGLPSDWWMLLTQEAKAMLLGHLSLGGPLPSEVDLANRSNVGAEAAINLGNPDQGSRLTRVEVGDGRTAAEMAAGRECRFNLSPATDLYFYFNIDDSFAFREAAGLDVTIEVEYLDREGNVELTLEYDSPSAPYTLHPKRIFTTGSGRWRSARFELANAYFGNRQNNGADFRVRLVQTVKVHIDRVWVRKEAWNSATAASGPDCNQNGAPDWCDLASGASRDCNGNETPDECDIASRAAQDWDADGVPDECERLDFVRGDHNGDGVVDISDAVKILLYLFAGVPVGCISAGDLDDNGFVNLADPITLLRFLFRMQSPPRAPFPGCGLDPTADDLSCASFPACN